MTRTDREVYTFLRLHALHTLVILKLTALQVHNTAPCPAYWITLAPKKLPQLLLSVHFDVRKISLLPILLQTS